MSRGHFGQFFRESRNRILLGMIVAIFALGIGIGSWLAVRSRPHFADEQIEAWSKAVADLDEQIQFCALRQPQKHNVTLLALKLKGQPTEPLEIWKNLETLLRLKAPGPAQFREMRNLAGNLYVLVRMFDADDKYSWQNIQQQFKDLQGEIIHWQNIEGHL